MIILLLENSCRIIEKARKYKTKRKNKKKRIGHYAVLLKNQNKVIGNVGFNNISQNATNGEIGICLNPDFWGNNLAYELTEVLLQYGFNK